MNLHCLMMAKLMLLHGGGVQCMLGMVSITQQLHIDTLSGAVKDELSAMIWFPLTL